MTHDTVNKRLEKIAEFAKSRLAEVANPETDDLDYRWYHTLRVSSYGKLLAQAEGADVELVIAACLLHDIAVFDPDSGRDHGRLAAEICQPFLESLGYTLAQVDNICYSIASHVDVEKPKTLEACVVTDADNVDRFGAYRAFQWVSSHRGEYNTMVSELVDRIQHLRKYRQDLPLQTPTGNTMFADQLDIQIGFFEAIVKESDWAVVPKI